ncbi:phospho-sugar mutase [Lysinibacillus sp. KU-BSD001]|uniref:phospho-sugar mutase n=1 Tax=Lysinibacillus sp. KU-BSD001 TaxID=3141328 RepID=UPI0036F2E265
MKTVYHQWVQSSFYKNELQAITDETEIADRFYQTVPFGTGGMRGKLGAGTNRMNIHTIRLVAEGLAREIEQQGQEAKRRGVVIAYDTRHFSQAFAYETAGVLAAHHIKSYVFTETRPTPELSFAVRQLHAYAGVVITASHNPKQYNGFKVYGEDGAQLTPQFADKIVSHMNAVEDIFEIQALPREQLLASGFCMEMLDELDDAYNTALQSFATARKKALRLVYTPLHGAGLVPTTRALREAGFINLHIVEEQAIPSGEFPTVAYPNPEEVEAFKLAIALGYQVEADLLLATDPDADRLGVAVWDGEYKFLTGNQLGALLLNYILQTKCIPQNAAMIKTIVTSELGTAIASKYGVTTINTLTGFKFIAEKIAEWEQTGEYAFMFGYEESYGYLAGDFVRDKDAVQMALLTAEMAAYYKAQGQTLLDVLYHLYEELGWYKEALVSLTFEGIEGQQKMASIMETFRQHPPTSFAGIAVEQMEDYRLGNINGLPKADVVKFMLADESWICVRPSGTEPKCKFYIGVKAQSETASMKRMEQLQASLRLYLQ